MTEQMSNVEITEIVKQFHRLPMSQQMYTVSEVLRKHAKERKIIETDMKMTIAGAISAAGAWSRAEERQREREEAEKREAEETARKQRLAEINKIAELLYRSGGERFDVDFYKAHAAYLYDHNLRFVSDDEPQDNPGIPVEEPRGIPGEPAKGVAGQGIGPQPNMVRHAVWDMGTQKIQPINE